MSARPEPVTITEQRIGPPAPPRPDAALPCRRRWQLRPALLRLSGLLLRLGGLLDDVRLPRPADPPPPPRGLVSDYLDSHVVH